MTARAKHLRLVQEESPSNEDRPGTEWGDLALIGALFAVNAVPVTGELLRPGHWGSGTVAFAMACLVLAGRELVSQVRDLRRARG